MADRKSILVWIILLPAICAVAGWFADVSGG
jgi:hypothetical protein